MKHFRLIVAFAGLALVIGAAGAMTLSNSNRAAQDSAAMQDARSAGHPEKWAAGGSLERLTPDNSVFLFVDHQSGLMNIVDNVETNRLKHYTLALAETAKLHGVPVILTTSDEAGPNGPLWPELRAIFPDAPLISRPGQINAFDNRAFTEAVEATGRKKVIISGITTDVCVAFATLSALEMGYDVHVVADASGTMNEQVQDAAIMRMADAGATITNWFAVSAELLGDWRNSAGPGSAKLFSERLPGYAEAIASHRSAADTARSQ